jgi:hypothetical protein
MIETMYYYDYKSSVKPYRIGFFYMMAFLTEASATETQAIWSPVEQTFLNSVIERAHELWKEIQMEGKQKPEEDSSHLLFIPTKEESDHEEEIRVLPQPPPKASQKATKKVVLGKTEEIRGLIPMKPSSSKHANHAKLAKHAKHEKQANQAKYDKHTKNPTSSSFKSIKDPTQSVMNHLSSSSSQKVIELRATRKEAFGGRGKTEETTHPVVLESTEWDGDDEEDVWGVQKDTDEDRLAPAPAPMQMPPQQKQRESKESLSITNLDDSWLIDGFPCRVDSGHRRVHSGKARPGIQDRSWEKNHR